MEQINTLLETAFGRYQLQRFPVNKAEKLRAWDAADEYVLQHLDENKLLTENISLLIVNDGFGGLSIPLSRYKPVVMIDSYLASHGIVLNSQNNTIDEDAITISNSLDRPEDIFTTSVDIVLIKLPKSLAMLEDQLHRIRPVLSSTTIIIAAGMTKNIHMSTMKLFEKIIGDTKTSLARKKSRLIFSQVDERLTVSENPFPTSYTLPYKLDGIDLEVNNHAAVFSQDKLDVGARFFVENLPADEKYTTIVDLGCGNGVLGVMAAIKNPTANLVFTDESYMAVESAISNFVSVFEETREAEFLQTDCLQGVEDNSVSLILCNPPFHQNNAITDNVAWQMFSESKEALTQKGELWVIANRHLAYHAKLKTIFGNCEVVASNNKFTLLKVIKS
ncbi:MAG: 50S rRNA methyltransferase [Gammaproteobacteria bacterium]|nr:MAG: 50S rRNA methyltransferase [Gammaproteobacteria bacterium]